MYKAIPIKYAKIKLIGGAMLLKVIWPGAIIVGKNQIKDIILQIEFCIFPTKGLIIRIKATKTPVSRQIIFWGINKEIENTKIEKMPQPIEDKRIKEANSNPVFKEKYCIPISAKCGST